MAQSQNGAPAIVYNAEADAEAWRIASANRKYRVFDGAVYSGISEVGLFDIVPLEGISLLPERLRPMVAQALLQYLTNRVGQTAGGDVGAVVNKAMTTGEIPSANTNDAFDRWFMQVVTDRVRAAKPVPELAKNASEEQKKAHAAAVAAQEVAIEATYRVNRYDSDGKTDSAKFLAIVREGIAAAKSRPIAEKKKRIGKAADTSAAIDL